MDRWDVSFGFNGFLYFSFIFVDLPFNLFILSAVFDVLLVNDDVIESAMLLTLVAGLCPFAAMMFSKKENYNQKCLVLRLGCGVQKRMK